MKKYNAIDLFSGCGGLLEGFLKSGYVNHIASVEWEKAPVATLKKRLEDKWGYKDTEHSVIRFDVQRIDELFEGFNDPNYGEHEGLSKLIGNRNIDIIIGGPPCQSYSVAGRIRDTNKMSGDYRNYLFEYYMKIVERLQPKMFIFENVPGMLSAMPDGTPIIDDITRAMNEKGYDIIDDVRGFALLDTSEYGIPQQRRRVILLGLKRSEFSEHNTQELLRKFYTYNLPKYKTRMVSVREAISDLPPCYPLYSDTRPSHTVPDTKISWHYSRYHGLRDVKIFKMLADDLQSEFPEFIKSEKLCEIYNEATGADTKVHKYHVLRPDKPSTTILAHLHKDGLRFIHYDPKQARSITVREAARLQTFDDDFDFVGSQGDAFKMIGNAVPPMFAAILANALNDFLKEI